jgi:hypothetical protein
MQNYSQNSNNYFENMLGETANIRSTNTPYFKILIIPEKIPYYKNNGKIDKWETFSLHNSKKYSILSNDDFEKSTHTPTKTLLFVIKLPDFKADITNKSEYKNYFQGLPKIVVEKSDFDYGVFGNAVILNNYPVFIEKIVHYIKSL